MDPAHSLLLAPPLHPSPAQLWPLSISHAKLGSPPPTPHPHPQQGKKLPSEAQTLTKNPCLYCQTPQKSIIDTRIYLPQTQQGTKKQLLWLQVSQVLETQKSGSSWGGSRPGGGKQLYTLDDAELSVFDSKRAESEECRLEVRLLARVQSHDHHGISKKLKGLGEGGRGQIIIPL